MSSRTAATSSMWTLGWMSLVAFMGLLWVFFEFMYYTALPWLHSFALIRFGMGLALWVGGAGLITCAIVICWRLMRRVVTGFRIWIWAVGFAALVLIGLRFEYLSSFH